MARVFISYSSDDEAFARELHAALESDHQVWLDSHAITAGTDFRASIDAALEACECVLVVRTPAWLASEVCRYEAARATEWRKRILPVEPRPLPRNLAWPPSLEGLSPIGFWRQAGHAAALKKLRLDLDADHAWLAAHAELLVDALRWQRSGGQDLRLRGPALREAIRMVERTAAGGAAPGLLPVQGDYVRACEAAESAEIKRLTFLNRRAVSRHLAAEAQRAWAEHPARIGLALRLAGESLRRAPGTVARDLAAKLVRLAPRPSATLPGTAGAQRLCWSPRGRWLALALEERVLVWRRDASTRAAMKTWLARDGVIDLRFDGDDLVILDGRRQVHRCALTRGTARAVAIGPSQHAALSSDGRRVAWSNQATLWVGSTAGGAAAPSPRRFELPQRVREIALSRDGSHVAVATPGTLFVPGAPPPLLRLIDAGAGTWIDLDNDFRMSLVFSADGRWLVAQTHFAFDVWEVANGRLAMPRQQGSFEAWWAMQPPTVLFSNAVLTRDVDEHAPRTRRLSRQRVDAGGVPPLLAAVQDLHGPLHRLELPWHECLAGTTGNATRVADLQTGSTFAIIEQQSEPRLATQSDSGLLATVSERDPVRIFDLAPSNDPISGPFIAAIGAVAASANGKWLARALGPASGGNLVALRLDGSWPHNWKVSGEIGPLAVAGNGRVAAVATSVHHVSTAGSQTIGQAALVVGDATGLRQWPREEPSTALAIALDGRHVAELLHDGRVAWLQPDSPAAEPRVLDLHSARTIMLDPTGRWLLVLDDMAGCEVRDLDQNAACVSRRTGVACAAFESTARRGATALWVAGVAGGLRRLALPSGRCTRRLAWPTPPRLLGPGRGPKTLWLAQGATLLAVDARCGTVLQRAELANELMQVLPSPSRRYLWVATIGGAGSVLRIPECERCLEPEERHATVAWLAGDRLAVRDGARMRIESMSLDALLAEIAARTGPTLREDEWRRYLPDEPWPGVGQSECVPWFDPPLPS